ncbi:MAG: bi-domain-containing oxidoreductase [Candidatus Scalindua sp.]
MKQIVQNYKDGTLEIEQVPEPVLKSGGVLVQTYHSLISAGTEKMKIDDSKRSYLGMARARPEKARQVIETFKQLGPVATYRKVMNRLDSLTPLGYSTAGRVIAVGENAPEFRVGDMVACAGAEIANHAEINSVPINLCCKVPKVSKGAEGDENGYLSTEQAAFTTVGAIAMQAVRQAEIHVGENVAVIGLGLVGLLSCLILKAAGCNVMGLDIDPAKVNLAADMSVETVGIIGSVDVEQMALSFSSGYGVDAVLVTTGTTSNEPIVTAGKIARDRATIVDVGMNKMDIPWQLYYSKELVLKQTRSYGPGRYDPDYEINGHDYPIGYVRWTEKRNMSSFLNLMACGNINVTPLITHWFNFNEAAEAYKLIEGKSSGFYVGIILKYDIGAGNLQKSRLKTIRVKASSPDGKVNIGVIGAGNFARTMLLPYIKGKDVKLSGIATATGISAKDTARKFGIEVCTTDYEELLKNDAINTILIATRHNLHGKLVIESLKAGKHVYTEKPLCITFQELEDISKFFAPDTMHHAPCSLMVGFNRRYAPLIKEMKSFLESRKEPMIMHYRVNAGFKEKTDWYQNKNIGGGRIIGEVCHFVDIFQYLTEAVPISVFAHTINTDNHATTLEDNVIITIQFSDGSIGSITYFANGDPQLPKEYIEIICEKKIVIMNNFSSLTTMARGKKKVKRSIIQDKGHKTEMNVFIESVRDQKPMPILFESLYATTLTCFAILESIETKKMVEVKCPEISVQ